MVEGVERGIRVPCGHRGQCAELDAVVCSTPLTLPEMEEFPRSLSTGYQMIEHPPPISVVNRWRLEQTGSRLTHMAEAHASTLY